MSATKNAASHAGRHGDFSVVWCDSSYTSGWYCFADFDGTMGPYETSQEAFGHRKDAIDLEYIDANH
jgi:hypothetical protein